MPFPPQGWIPSQTFWANRYAPSVIFPRRYKVGIPIPPLPSTWRTNFGDYLRRNASGLSVNAPTGLVDWSYTLVDNTSAENGWLVADIDLDGVKELILSWYGATIACYRYGVGRIWDTSIGGGVRAQGHTLSDVDGDGRLEVFGSVDGSVAGGFCALACLNEDGVLLWHDGHLHDAFTRLIVVEDIDLDNILEVLQSDGFPHTKCFKADDGTPIWTVDGDEFADFLADIDQDGQYELIGRDGAGGINIYRPDGTLKLSFSTGRPNAVCHFIEDVDGDGKGELIIYCHDGTYWNIIQVRKPDGSLVIEIATGVAENLVSFWGKAMADLTGDGAYEVVLHSPSGVVRCYRLTDGSLLWSATVGTGGTSMAIADVDGDGELEVIVGCGDVVTIACLEPTGTTRWSLDQGLLTHRGGIAIEDANNDGQGDITLSEDDGVVPGTLHVLQG